MDLPYRRFAEQERSHHHQHQFWEKIGLWERVHRQHQVQAGCLTNLPFHPFYELSCAKKKRYLN